jgi:hypothetical protein
MTVQLSPTEELLAEVVKNATEVVRIRRIHFEGHELIDVRVYYRNAVGEFQPTKRGICLRPEMFAALVQAAQEVARRLGLGKFDPFSEE